MVFHPICQPEDIALAGETKLHHSFHVRTVVPMETALKPTYWHQVKDSLKRNAFLTIVRYRNDTYADAVSVLRDVLVMGVDPTLLMPLQVEAFTGAEPEQGFVITAANAVRFDGVTVAKFDRSAEAQEYVEGEGHVIEGEGGVFYVTHLGRPVGEFPDVNTAVSFCRSRLSRAA